MARCTALEGLFETASAADVRNRLEKPALFTRSG
jgi:hypothetical protein